MEVLDHSVLQNSGTLTLEGAATSRTKARSRTPAPGTIEISGGTLNVQVDIANAGQITVDAGAALALGGVTRHQHGGTITIDGTGKMTLNGATIDGGTIKNSLTLGQHRRRRDRRHRFQHDQRR